jgi:hypothetical protein
MLENFPTFSSAVHERFKQMSESELYVVDTVDIFATYLAAFPEGTNPIFRERTEHDCQCCKQFIRNLGRLVTIENGVVGTVWDIEGLPYPYDIVARTLSDIVKQSAVRSIYRTKERKYGTEYNYDTETSRRWNHLHGDVSNRHYSSTPDAERGASEAVIQVMRRGLEEITVESAILVMDLIRDNDIYRGAEFKPMIVDFVNLQAKYVDSKNKEFFILENLNDRAARFRNTVIGTLLVDISDGVDIDKAVRSFEAKVAPENYKRPTAVITSRMVDEAVTTLKTLGLEEAVERRFAKISDVSVNNVIFVNNATQSKMKDGIAGLLADTVKSVPTSIKNATPITINEFLETIVPKAKSIEVLVENKHLPNFVSLTAPAKENTGQLFQWGNDFAWSYDGEVTDSIKQRVKAAGGNVDAKMRVSLAWFNTDDLDIHAYLPNGEHIYFGNKRNILDVDMNVGSRVVRDPVENLAFNGKLIDGVYRIEVNNFNKRESIDVGFTLEVQFENQIEQYQYDKALPGHNTVRALELTVAKGRLVTVKTFPGITGGSTPINKWNITTETLVPVDTLMFSPNHWDGEQTGNKHVFFMLKGCKNPEPVRGIYNEFLKGNLAKHRKVFEVLGSKTKCPPTDDQLSGLGFSSTKQDEVKLVVDNRAYTVKF